MHLQAEAHRGAGEGEARGGCGGGVRAPAPGAAQDFPPVDGPEPYLHPEDQGGGEEGSGQTGQGGLGPNLTGGASNAHFPSEADQIDFVKKGSELGKKYGLQGQGSGRMPGFGNMLTDGQIKAIIEYVRSL